MNAWDAEDAEFFHRHEKHEKAQRDSFRDLLCLFVAVVLFASRLLALLVSEVGGEGIDDFHSVDANAGDLADEATMYSLLVGVIGVIGDAIRAGAATTAGERSSLSSELSPPDFVVRE